MDWFFYAVFSAVVFVVIAMIIGVRYYLSARLEELEERHEKEEDARTTAESNSGL